MMELMQWLQLLNDQESQSLLAKNANNIIMIGYVIVYLITKRAEYFSAFFICVMLVGSGVAQSTSEVNMYLIVFVLYSYVFKICKTGKSKLGCVTILSLSLTLAVESFFYGENGYNGTYSTIIYSNIEYLALFAHIFFISTLVSYSRIRDSLRDLASYVMRVSANSDYM